MNIYVCVKHVPDSAATITIRGKNQIDEGVTFLLNPYDEHAVEEANRLKELLLEKGQTAFVVRDLLSLSPTVD